MKYPARDATHRQGIFIEIDGAGQAATRTKVTGEPTVGADAEIARVS
jgi:hypothetical protein